jgi:hypothetical protein
MPNLTDRQRLELALPASMIYVLTGAPDVFVPANQEMAVRAAADITMLRADLRTAFMEPFEDLTPTKRRAMFRRLERLNKVAAADWHEHTALHLLLVLWCFLRDLTDREVLILWEGSTMDRAMQRLMPMCEHGFVDPAAEALAQEQAGILLDRLRAEGLYR